MSDLLNACFSVFLVDSQLAPGQDLVSILILAMTVFLRFIRLIIAKNVEDRAKKYLSAFRCHGTDHEHIGKTSLPKHFGDENRQPLQPSDALSTMMTARSQSLQHFWCSN